MRHRLDGTTWTFCMAVDDRGGVVTFDGRRWSPRRTVGAVEALSGLSCTASRSCVVEVARGPLLEYRNGRRSAPALAGAGNP